MEGSNPDLYNLSPWASCVEKEEENNYKRI